MIASIRQRRGAGLLTSTALSMAFAFFAADQLPANQPNESEKYSFAYKLKQDEMLTFRVEHLAKTKVKVSDTVEVSQMRTVSTKVWQVTEVDGSGQMTFENGIVAVEMTQQSEGKDEIRWTSSSDEIPPVQFAGVAKRLGKVLSTISINAQGQVIKRTGEGPDSSSLGMGDITMPLPKDPIAIGGQWSVPREVKLKNKEGVLKLVKIRELYTLEKVHAGVATVSVRSEPLTPIDDQEMRGQLVQQLSNGSVRFDLDAGRVVSKQLDWDENVVGFQGPASNLEYQARLTETLETEKQATAKLTTPLTR